MVDLVQWYKLKQLQNQGSLQGSYTISRALIELGLTNPKCRIIKHRNQHKDILSLVTYARKITPIDGRSLQHIPSKHHTAGNQRQQHDNNAMERSPHTCANSATEGQKLGSSHKRRKTKLLDSAKQPFQIWQYCLPSKNESNFDPPIQFGSGSPTSVPFTLFAEARV